MAPKSKKWTYYTLNWLPEYVKVKDSYLIWPVSQFEKLAQKLGFGRLEKDGSLIGGYFVNSDGDCLFCVPFGMNPENIH